MRTFITTIVASALFVAAGWYGMSTAADTPVEEIPRYANVPENDHVTVDPVVQRSIGTHPHAARDWQRFLDCRSRLGLDPTAGKTREHASKREVRRCRANLKRHLKRERNAAFLRGDFHKQLRRAATFFGVSYGWLHGCVHNEGGHGPAMIWNRSGSSAFGPAQFMPGTYTRMATGAVAEMRARGIKVPPSFFFGGNPYSSRPDTLSGQAWAMAWGFSQGRSGEWVAPGC